MVSPLDRTPHESICWRLGHYLFLQSGRSDLIYHVVASSLRCVPNQSGTYSAVRNKVQDLFGLSLPEVEIRAALEGLARQNEVLKPPSDPQVYSLEPRAAQRLQTLEDEAKNTESLVFDQWEQHLLASHPELSAEEASSLRVGLLQLLRNTYQRLGAEAVHLFSGGLAAAWPNGLGVNLPPPLDTMLLVESTRFFSEGPAERRVYLRRWFNGSLCIHTLYLDQEAAKVLKRQWTRGVLYIDSNLLYRLLGLQGPEREQAAIALVKLSREAGFAVTVTTRTVDELAMSLRRAAGILREHEGRLSTAAAETVLRDHTIGEDYYKAFCRARVAHGATVDVFNAKFANLKPLLRSFEILVDDVSAVTFEEDEYYSTMFKELSDRRQGRPDAVQEHDAFHLRYVDKLRQGRNIQSLLEARTWFLTCDMSLLRYDEHYSGRHHIRAPRCILADAWLAFIPSMVPATANFDAAWGAYVMNPLFQSYEEISGETALRIVGNMGLFGNNYDALTEALHDEHLRASIIAAKTPEEERAAVDDWALRVADHYREQAETALKIADDTVAAAKDAVSKTQSQAAHQVATAQAHANQAIDQARREAQEAAERSLRAEQRVQDAEGRFIEHLAGLQEQHSKDLREANQRYGRLMHGVYTLVAVAIAGLPTYALRKQGMKFVDYFLRGDQTVPLSEGYWALTWVAALVIVWFIAWCIRQGAADRFLGEGTTTPLATMILTRMRKHIVKVLFYLVLTVAVGVLINLVSPTISRDIQAPPKGGTSGGGPWTSYM